MNLWQRFNYKLKTHYRNSLRLRDKNNRHDKRGNNTIATTTSGASYKGAGTMKGRRSETLRKRI